MKPFEKQMMRYWIVRRDTLQNFDFTQDFFSMDMRKVCRLGNYAEIFGIKGTASGKSPARNLWEQLQRAHQKVMIL